MGEFVGTDEQLLNALRAMPIRGGITGQVVSKAAADKIQDMQAEIDQLEQDIDSLRENAESAFRRGYYQGRNGE